MKRPSGFTLIELAIALAIVMILAWGILKGQSLLDAARIANTIKLLDQLKVATEAFNRRYHAEPGDLSNAANLIGKEAVNCSQDCDNGQTNPWSNTSLVTNHLQAAGLYNASGKSLESNSPPDASNAPETAWGSFVFVAYWNQFVTPEHSDQFGGPSKRGVYSGALPVRILAEIDRKIDDGNPATGKFRAAWPGSAEQCVINQRWSNDDTLVCGGVQLF